MRTKRALFSSLLTLAMLSVAIPTQAAEADPIVVVRGNKFLIRDTADGGWASDEVVFGRTSDFVVFGDWDGDGIKTPGIVRDGQWFLRKTRTVGDDRLAVDPFIFGRGTDIPIVGDWDGNGTDTVGIYRVSERKFYLRNSNSGGPDNVSYVFGQVGDSPIVGNWDGSGGDTVGVYRTNPATGAGTFLLRNSHSGGNADVTINLGNIHDDPVSGDWNGDGKDTVGVFRDGIWTITDSTTSGSPTTRSFQYGQAGDVTPIAPLHLYQRGSSCPQTYFHPTKKESFNLQNVYGICVRSSASHFSNLLVAAADSDLGSGILRGGGFRSYEHQTQLRATRMVDRGYCPTGTYISLNSNPVIFTVNVRLCTKIFDPAFKLTPANTAAPGSSNHELGRAIDFTASGASVEFSTPGWNWLASNACYRFGFTPLPKTSNEAWHWQYLNDSWFQIPYAQWKADCDSKILGATPSP